LIGRGCGCGKRPERDRAARRDKETKDVVVTRDILQGVRQELVHLGDAGGDAEVDGSVADLDDETANNVGVDLKE
jgi:hypothetical protein